MGTMTTTTTDQATQERSVAEILSVPCEECGGRGRYTENGVEYEHCSGCMGTGRLYPLRAYRNHGTVCQEAERCLRPNFVEECQGTGWVMVPNFTDALMEALPKVPDLALVGLTWSRPVDERGMPVGPYEWRAAINIGVTISGTGRDPDHRVALLTATLEALNVAS